jgi:hypothetical protein
MLIVISQHPRRAKPLAIGAEMYKCVTSSRTFSASSREFKRLAMRADKTDQSFAVIICLAAAVVESR